MKSRIALETVSSSPASPMCATARSCSRGQEAQREIEYLAEYREYRSKRAGVRHACLRTRIGRRPIDHERTRGRPGSIRDYLKGHVFSAIYRHPERGLNLATSPMRNLPLGSHVRVTGQPCSMKAINSESMFFTYCCVLRRILRCWLVLSDLGSKSRNRARRSVNCGFCRGRQGFSA